MENIKKTTCSLQQTTYPKTTNPKIIVHENEYVFKSFHF